MENRRLWTRPVTCSIGFLLVVSRPTPTTADDGVPLRAVVHLVAADCRSGAYQRGEPTPALWSADVALEEGVRARLERQGERAADVAPGGRPALRTTSDVGVSFHAPGLPTHLIERIKASSSRAGPVTSALSTTLVLERSGPGGAPILVFEGARIEETHLESGGTGRRVVGLRSHPAQRFLDLSASSSVAVLATVEEGGTVGPAWTVDAWQRALVGGLRSWVDASKSSSQPDRDSVSPVPPHAVLLGLRCFPTPAACEALAAAAAIAGGTDLITACRLACGDPLLLDTPIGSSGMRWMSTTAGPWAMDVPLLVAAASRTRDERVRSAILEELRGVARFAPSMLGSAGATESMLLEARMAPLAEAIDRGALVTPSWFGALEARADTDRLTSRLAAWILFGAVGAGLVALMRLRHRRGLVGAAVLAGILMTCLTWGTGPRVDQGVEIAGAVLLAVATGLLALDGVGVARWISPGAFAITAAANLADWLGSDSGLGLPVVMWFGSVLGVVGLLALAESRRRAAAGDPPSPLRAWHVVAVAAYVGLSGYVAIRPTASSTLDLPLAFVASCAALGALLALWESLAFSPRSPAPP